MTATLNEQQQWVDGGGEPLVNGKAYYGIQNADPIVSPISIFSDRALTVALANPQTLDANGRTANKVWIGARYSIRVDNSADVQQYQELDNGEADDIGLTALENVAGSNTITATATTTITAYVDLEQYTFRTVSVNTGAVTLNIDSVGAKSIVKNQDQAILPSEFEADQNIIVSYNSTSDNFEWVNHNDKIVAFYEGSAVVAAATTEIWDSAGNTVHVTGSTGITSLGTAPVAGAIRWVIFDGAPILTHSTSLNLPGGVNFTAAAGDMIRVYADTTTQLDVTIDYGADQRRVDANGIVTNAAQPAFRAQNLVLNNVTGDGTDFTIVFATEIFDQNADFDGTSTFTAPVAGRYLLTAFVEVSGITAACDSMSMTLVTSNKSYVLTRNQTNTTVTARAFQFSIVTDMDAADTATVKILNTGEASAVHDIAAGDAQFSGVLLV